MLNDKLQEIAFGDIKRLMVFLPPRHGKSMLVSHYFPAWYLGMFPINGLFSRLMKLILQHHGVEKPEIYLMNMENLFYGVEVDNKSSAANRWDIQES